MVTEPETGTRPRGRPATPVLSQQKITEAAMRLIDHRGYAGLTMAALARELRVAPSALYNHVTSKRDVLRWIQDHVNGGVDDSAFAEVPWDEALVRWARSYRDAYARHAPLVPVIAVTPIAGSPHTVGMYERVTRGLLDGGWPADRVLSVITAVESFILGSAMDATAPADIYDPGHQREGAPTLVGVLEAWHGSGRDGGTAREVDGDRNVSADRAVDAGRAPAAFETGLAAMVAGLRAQLAALPRR